MAKPSILFHSKYPICVILILLIFSFHVSIFASDPVNLGSLVSTFRQSQNSIERRLLVRSLSNIEAAKGLKAPSALIELLDLALNDVSPVVRAEAARQIGQFQLIQFNHDLISLYNQAEALFNASGYTQRVQYAVISALGKIASSEAKQLVVNLLRKDNGFVLGEYLLLAVKDFSDPALISELQAYKAKMENYVTQAKMRGDDPLLYDRRARYAKLVTEVEQSILNGGN